MSLGVRRDVVLSGWETKVTRFRAESLRPPDGPSKTIGVMRRLWNVRLIFSHSARFWVEVVVGPGIIAKAIED